MEEYTFPFGQQVKKLIQEDRSPKSVFVLGVYASAVHARWIAPDGKTTVVTALAVASERPIPLLLGEAQMWRATRHNDRKYQAGNRCSDGLSLNHGRRKSFLHAIHKE